MKVPLGLSGWNLVNSKRGDQINVRMFFIHLIQQAWFVKQNIACFLWAHIHVYRCMLAFFNHDYVYKYYTWGNMFSCLHQLTLNELD